MPLGHRHSEETKRKMSTAHKGKPKEHLKGVPRTQEVKDKIRSKLKGRIIGERTTEWRRRISESLKGHEYWGRGKGYRITGKGLENIRRGIENRYTKEYGKKLSKSQTGVNNNQSVLTEIQVKEIRELYKTKVNTQQSLANKYGVARTTIADIVNYRTWTHL